jgi:hypothetical protein
VLATVRTSVSLRTLQEQTIIGSPLAPFLVCFIAVTFGLRRKSQRFPLYPEERTSATADAMSVSCQIRRLMHRSKQLKLFDHFGEQKMRDCDLAELARVKRVDFPKAICA